LTSRLSFVPNALIKTMTNFIHIRFASIWPSQFSKNLFPQSSP
jgi:hypothetical protein